MDFLSVAEIAKKWGISERSVRNYCAAGRVLGAFLTGKTWNIPAHAKKPARIEKTDNTLLNILREQKAMGMSGGIYHKIQIELTYNSNHIEGSRLTEEQTRYIFETNTIGVTSENVNVDHVIETANHFKCIDYVINNADAKLNEGHIKMLHLMLKSGTSDSRKNWFAVGGYKKIPNEVGGKETTLPENVKKEMQTLIANCKEQMTIQDIIEFHYQFERIHPFQDGNGRVGRLIMLWQCLHNNIVPFIIDEQHKIFYYRGLNEWQNEQGFLLETCLSAQDKFKTYLDYFNIEYKN